MREKLFLGKMIVIFGVVTALLPILLAIFRMPVDCDSAYYLSIVERINDGYIPYRNLALGYTPLWFYMLFLLKRIFSIGLNWEFFLAVHFTTQLASAFFVFKISEFFTQNKFWSTVSAWLFLISSHWLQGNVLLLETPSIMFGLMACYLALKYSDKSLWFLWIGVISACAFLVKQYGFGFYFLVVLLVLFNSDRWKQILYLTIGYAFVLVVCSFIWGHDFWKIVFNGYGTNENAEMLIGEPITPLLLAKRYFGMILFFVKRIYPLLIVGMLLVPQMIKYKKYKELFFCVCGILGFALQSYFNLGLHYYLYLIPFAAIFSGSLMVLKTNKIIKTLYGFAFVVTILLSLYSTYYNRVYKYYIVSNQKKEQLALAKIILSKTKQADKLYIPHGGMAQMYYLTNLLPPNLSTIGYSFGALGISEAEAMKQVRDADFVLHFKKDYPYEVYFTKKVKDLLLNYESEEISDGVILCKKR